MQPKPCARCAQMPYISPGFICHTEGCRWAITAEMIRQPKESDMAEKMTLEQVRDWHRQRETTFRRLHSKKLSAEHRGMADAIDAHIAQPAHAVDVEREIACALAEADGFDPDDQHGGLYDLRWSGGPAPEPMGDAWTMDYLPKAEQIAKRITRAIGNAHADD